MSTDTFGMGSNLAVRPIPRGAYSVVSATSHFRIVDGRTYRDHVVRLVTGELRIVAVLERSAA
jgi:hypothetical protein